MRLVFATNNQHKLDEIQRMLDSSVELINLEQLGCFEEIPETSDTLEGNAIEKAHFVFSRYNIACFADDTGLEVEALNNEPGVISARYAGSQRSAADNMAKLLTEMDKINHRKARFRTVIALILNGKEILFEGIVDGEIIREPRGNEGFGYDPVFKPFGYEQTFAEMDMRLKNTISHRGRAVAKLVEYLNTLNRK